MNDRIQELLEQATEVYDYWYRGESVCMVNYKMFAELIVRECIGIVEGMAPGYTDYRNQIEDSLKIDTVSKIKRQFGLQEEPEPEFDK